MNGDTGVGGLIGESDGGMYVNAYATGLVNAGQGGHFGSVTQEMLAEFQASVGISPASGYFGPETRAYIKQI